MFDKQRIKEITTTSKAERWPFPRTLNALKEAGVDYYDVQLSNHEVIYYGKGESLKDSGITDLQNLPPIGVFDLSALKAAIHKHQVERTSYAEVMHEIVRAGIARYRVDILKRTCTYFGRQTGEEYAESFP
jgi:uncharacterized protein YbcV (DUF1398 family)